MARSPLNVAAFIWSIPKMQFLQNVSLLATDSAFVSSSSA